MHPKLLEMTVQSCREYIAAGDCHGEAPPTERLIDAVVQLSAAPTGAQPAPAAPSDTQAVIAPPSDRDQHFGGSSYDASLLRELLAVIHRDGGHYIAQHGIEKACADAAAQWLAAPAAQPADSAMEVLRELVYLHGREWNVNAATPTQAEFNAAWDRARAVIRSVAKETPHVR